MKLFNAAKSSLGGLDAKAVAALLGAAADITLILDPAGVIRDMAVGSASLADALGGAEGWAGTPWADCVMLDSRPKVESLVRDARPDVQTRWRHVNHAGAASGGRTVPIPVLYCTVTAGPGRVVAFGRDERQAAALHQRLVDAQGSLERDYARLRHAEARYRLLFQMSSEAAVVLDPAENRVVESNPAAERLCGARAAAGRVLPDTFGPDSPRVAAMLAEVRFAGRASEVRARLAGAATREVTVAASPFRQERTTLLLVRLLPAGLTTDSQPPSRAELLRLAEAAPDALVLTGGDGRVAAANAAFLELAQLEAEEQAVGEPLDRWLGRPGPEFEVLVGTLRTRGAVRLFPTLLRGEHGTDVDVEVNAAPLGGDTPPGYGFAIRDVGTRLAPRAPAGPPLPRPVEQLTELVGRVPLKDLVRETTEVIERLAIEAALQLTEDNRASAAEMLGLSRQSLYVKLRRYGLGGGDAETEEG